MASVVGVAAIVRNKRHGIILRQIFGMLLNKLWTRVRECMHANVRGLPLVVFHKVGIVAAYS